MKKLISSFSALLLTSGSLLAVDAKTVPWAANNPLIPHDTWSGKAIRLKGTSDVYGPTITYSWDFGDGSPVAAGNVGTLAAAYGVEATHTYTAPVGTIFTARLTITDTSTSASDTANYYVEVQAQTLPVEVNVAIDEGLWYLHKTQTRLADGTGHWESGGFAATSFRSVCGSNVQAFEINGHKEDGAASNPYTETVARGLRRVFTYLRRANVSVQSQGNPDANGNGYGLMCIENTNNALGTTQTQAHENYQTGVMMDAIIASGTPTAVVPAGVGIPEVAGRTYQDIVQDLVDFYAFSQTEFGTPLRGSWYYYRNDQRGDNSAAQWAAIGLIPAERNWGCTVPSWVKTSNLEWLKYSTGTTLGNIGTFGYQGPNTFVWGKMATTPSGMVQLAMDGVGRGDPLWDNAETFMRDNFANGGGAANAIKENSYGLFALVKALLLHDSASVAGAGEPITLLQSQTAAVPPIDWYEAEVSMGDPTDGVARRLVNIQNAGGYWTGNTYYFQQNPYTTSWSIIMLQRTLFEAGSPVAVAKANPNPAVATATIQLDGSTSFHQDSGKSIVLYEWDLDNDGQFDDASGPFPTVSFPVIGSYPVALRVTDNSASPQTNTHTITILVSTPPVSPTADAGGPYVFCPEILNWYLDGTGSVNPDDGQSEDPPTTPGDSIVTYEWDLNGNNVFGEAGIDATGPQPNAKAALSALGVGSHLISLRVTDNTAASYPSSNGGAPVNLSHTASTTVVIEAEGECECITDLAARAKPGEIQLTWTDNPATDHYNVYRSEVAGGPYAFLASTTSDYSTYLDTAVVAGPTYYYVVREADSLNRESCQSNEASASAPSGRRGR